MAVRYHLLKLEKHDVKRRQKELAAKMNKESWLKAMQSSSIKKLTVDSKLRAVQIAKIIKTLIDKNKTTVSENKAILRR